jgi:hypothetical protein
MIILINCLLSAIGALISWLITTILGFNLGLFFLIFLSWMFVSSLILSKLKFRKRGNIIVDREGVTIQRRSPKSYSWNEIESIHLRVVNHQLIPILNRIGGFIRYNQLGYNEKSEYFYDKITIDHEQYYLLIDSKDKFKSLKEVERIIIERYGEASVATSTYSLLTSEVSDD